MPLYEYQCRSCDRRTEALQRAGDPPLTVCPECGGELRKLFSAPAFQFKGSGWYVTDYAAKQGTKSDTKPDSGSGAKPDGGKGEGAGAGGGAGTAAAGGGGGESAKPAAGGSGGSSSGRDD